MLYIYYSQERFRCYTWLVVSNGLNNYLRKPAVNRVRSTCLCAITGTIVKRARVRYRRPVTRHYSQNTKGYKSAFKNDPAC